MVDTLRLSRSSLATNISAPVFLTMSTALTNSGRSFWPPDSSSWNRPNTSYGTSENVVRNSPMSRSCASMPSPLGLALPWRRGCR